MTVTVTQTCNIALMKLGGDLLTDIETDLINTADTGVQKAAKMCNALFPTLRDEMLRNHPWNFAVARAQLTDSMPSPDFEFTYMFEFPDDCIRLLRIFNHNHMRFQVEGNTILTDSETIDIVYIREMEDPTEWDPLFLEAFATRLAAEIAYGLTGSNSLANTLMDQHYAKTRLAKQIDAQENYADPFTADEWVASRRSVPHTLDTYLCR